MGYSVVRAKIYRDNTGISIEIPVILTEVGPIESVMDYMVEYAHIKSPIWMQKLTQGICLLIDYIDANKHVFEDSELLFSSFVQKLYLGTIGEDGKDPSGLYWESRSNMNVRQLVSLITNYAEWATQGKHPSKILPLRELDKAEEIMVWAYWSHKRNNALLAHIHREDSAQLDISRRKKAIFKPQSNTRQDSVKYFDDSKIWDLIYKGFIVPGRQKSERIEERINLRDALITFLMHFGGVRVSEPFHLYVHDVMPDPQNNESALVRIFHPKDGAAPSDWIGINGSRGSGRRGEYLRSKYGMSPRNEYFSTDQLHAGWKNNLINDSGNFMYINWFPVWTGELFMKMWNMYMFQRAQMTCHHPFAFVTKDGSPYAISSFKVAHKRAIKRIGLEAGKMLGTTPHAHRHAYGQRLKMAKEMIPPHARKAAMHHRSINSQAIYMESSNKEVNEILAEATKSLENGDQRKKLDILAYGFKDVDPYELYSGIDPRLESRRIKK